VLCGERCPDERALRRSRHGAEDAVDLGADGERSWRSLSHVDVTELPSAPCVLVTRDPFLWLRPSATLPAAAHAAAKEDET